MFGWLFAPRVSRSSRRLTFHAQGIMVQQWCVLCVHGQTREKRRHCKRKESKGRESLSLLHVNIDAVQIEEERREGQ